MYAAESLPAQDRLMADFAPPHFHNDPGVQVIEIGAREFMCVGARPPFDHPHIFLDMGEEHEIICSYCSTLYRRDPSLSAHEARPAECALREPSGVRDPVTPAEPASERDPVPLYDPARR